MLSTLSLLKQRNPQTAFGLVRSLSTKATHFRKTARLPALTTCTTRSSNSNRSLLMMSKRPQVHDTISVLSAIQQQRQFSLWNIPLSLMTASPLKRRLTLVALGGAGLAFAVVLGPFLLVGIGGIAAVIGFRLWRMKRDLQNQLRNTGQPLQDWPDFLNAFMQQQGMGGGVFGKDQRQVETETIRRLELWAQSSRGRNQLIEYGIHPERIAQNVSMRGSSYASTSSNVTGTTTEIKIELDLRNAPGTILIASAQLDKESNNLTISDMKLVTATGHVLAVPLSIHQQNPDGRRVIEGEFYDV
ncbi:hypothetical protein HMPREF1544_04298 [Mucor circinelloides 1006PhL]|uniref:Uncharacterized protein n=1 Tax=Mucor circinelloides f. circinelloides (strain 1006PhL) TaxID=1220926 RepID=S2K168_MUCC1|nr:hypothetical protein HMPREF1544_04298 [Mucor circinelloides 1006PhL]